MAVTKITIQEFLLLAKSKPVLDVRSPGEYAHAHIPKAISLPLFTDGERAIVGTAYKQQSREDAIKIGLEYFGPNMRSTVEKVEEIIRNWQWQINPENAVEDKPATNKCILIHCWRGGMRSGAVAWLLDLYGFKVYTLTGGYKAYRNWVLMQFAKPYNFKIIGGYTGSGKTLLLHQLAKEKNSIIDLEGLANHKGSALGGLGNVPQPTQEMFENLLANALFEKSVSVTSNDDSVTQSFTDNPIFLEDESQRIGNLQLPVALWQSIRKAPIYFIDVPFEERLDYLTKEYGRYKKEELVSAIMRIQKRLGGLETKNAINFLLENNVKESFRILLHYYDKWYNNGHNKRDNVAELIKIIKAETIDTIKNVALIKETTWYKND